MIRIVYISGRYRHYNADGSFDRGAMLLELGNERKWMITIAECGMMWIAPLHNSVPVEHQIPLTADEFIERDCAIIRRLNIAYDVILMRQGWDEDPESVGATKEHDTAVKHGLLVVHGELGEEKVAEYLKGLNHDS